MYLSTTSTVFWQCFVDFEYVLNLHDVKRNKYGTFEHFLDLSKIEQIECF